MVKTYKPDTPFLSQQVITCIENRNIGELQILFDQYGKTICDTEGYFQETPLYCAISSKQNDIVLFLINNGASVDRKSEQGSSYLHVAADSNNEGVIYALKERGVFLDACDEDGNTALHTAAACGHHTVVQILLDLGASAIIKNIYFRNPVDEALNQNHPNIAHQIQSRIKHKF